MFTRWGSKLALAKRGCKCYSEVLIHLVQIASACLTGRQLGIAVRGCRKWSHLKVRLISLGSLQMQWPSVQHAAGTGRHVHPGSSSTEGRTIFGPIVVGWTHKFQVACYALYCPWLTVMIWNCMLGFSMDCVPCLAQRC